MNNLFEDFKWEFIPKNKIKSLFSSISNLIDLNTKREPAETVN